MTYYRQDLMTLAYPVNGNPEEKKSWVEAIRFAVQDLAISMSHVIAAPEASTQASLPSGVQVDLPEEVLEVLRKQGVPLNEETISSFKEVLGKNIKPDLEKVSLLAMVEIEKKLKAKKVINNWVNFANWPNKNPDYESGKTIYRQIFKMNKTKEATGKNESKEVPLMPLDDKGRYILYFPEVSEPCCCARKGFGRNISCQAYPYNRNPRDQQTYGIPMFKPKWVNVQSCGPCKFAPHRDKSQDSNYGITYEDGCKYYIENFGFFGGLLDQKPVLLWANLSVTGSMAYLLQTSPGMKLRPLCGYMIEINNIKLITEGTRKRRIFEDVTDLQQVPIFTRKDTVLYTFANLISGRIKDYYTKKMAPQNIEAPNVSTDFNSESYEQGSKSDELPDINPYMEPNAKDAEDLTLGNI